MSAESTAAKLDVYRVCLSYGVPITLFFEAESDVIRDEYESVISRSTSPWVVFNCHPIEVNPSQKAIEKVGIREMVDLLIYLSTYEWEQKGYSYSDLDLILDQISFQNENYKIEHRKLYSNFSSDYLYIVLGAMRN